MLNFTNTSQILAVANELIQNIVIMRMGSQQQDEALKNEFISKLMNYYFKSFLPIEDFNKLYEEAKVELAVRKDELNQQAQAGGAAY
jgi:hypothetical protein